MDEWFIKNNRSMQPQTYFFSAPRLNQFCIVLNIFLFQDVILLHSFYWIDCNSSHLNVKTNNFI